MSLFVNSYLLLPVVVSC